MQILHSETVWHKQKLKRSGSEPNFHLKLTYTLSNAQNLLLQFLPLLTSLSIPYLFLECTVSLIF